MLLLTQAASRSRLQQWASAALRLTLGPLRLAAELLLVLHCRRRLAAGHAEMESLDTRTTPAFQCSTNPSSFQNGETTGSNLCRRNRWTTLR